MSKPFYNRKTSLRPRSGRPLWSKPATPRRAPPSSALINAVLEHADLKDDMGGGRVLLRLSPQTIDDTDFGWLGAEAAELGGVAILWDEIEDQIVRVMDGRGAIPKAANNDTPRESEEPRFVLTPEAHAYIAANKGKARRG